jgi:putative heme-binding domain-containing protein
VPFEEDTSYPSFQQTRLHPDSPLHPPTAEGLNLGGTGFCGIAICDDRSGSFPAPWQGMFFVANPILGKVHAVSGVQQADGTWRFSRHADLLACDDPMFRPVAVAFGPDGALYVTDWYNRIISHNEVARDHPGRDKQNGRIWRVRHTSQREREILNFITMPERALPAALASDSRWAVRAAWHQIALRQDRSLTPELERMLRDEALPADVKYTRSGHWNPSAGSRVNLWGRLLAHADPHVRREAVRALGTLRPPVGRRRATPLPPGVRSHLDRAVRSAADVATAGRFRGAVDMASPLERAGGCDDDGAGLERSVPRARRSYQRAFQDFLLNWRSRRRQLPVVIASQWGGVIGRNESPRDLAAVAARVADVKSRLEGANIEQGRNVVETLCLTCHSIGRKGVGLAPPLDGSGARDLEGLITAIVAPDEAIEPVFRLYRIVTRSGETLEGFKQSEIRGMITVQFAGGAQTPVKFADIASAGYVEGRSVMPDVTAGMGAEQVAGVVAYLRTLR